MFCKVLVGEVWTVVIFHEVDNTGPNSSFLFPESPKPFRSKTRDAVDSKMHKNSNLDIIIPL